MILLTELNAFKAIKKCLVLFNSKAHMLSYSTKDFDWY